MSFRTYFDVPDADRSGLAGQIAEQRRRVGERLAKVRRVVLVVSGKGGVGKSYLTAALARAVVGRAQRGVGVLDADLRIEWRGPTQERFVWRGSLEVGTLREFLSDVLWGELDVLLIDLPPGADGVVELGGLIPDLAGAVAVTIPSEESRRSVSRTMRAAREAGIRLLGVIENMSGYQCGACATTQPLFPGNAGLVSSLGVKIGGQVLDEPPLEFVRSKMVGRDDAFVRVPGFVRGMVKKIYTDYAVERRIAEIPPAVMDQARAELGLEGM